MVTLSHESVKEYQRIWKDNFDREVPDDEAQEEAEHFINFLRPFLEQDLN